MDEPATGDRVGQQLRVLNGLVLANIAIWIISIIALIFIVQDYSGAKGLFPILFSGIAMGVGILSVLRASFSA